MQGLGDPEVEELLLDWLDPFLTEEEQDQAREQGNRRGKRGKKGGK